MGVMGVMTFYCQFICAVLAALGGFNADRKCGHNAEGMSAFMDPSALLCLPVRLTRLNRHHASRGVAGADADAGRVCAAVTLRFEAPQSCSVTLAVSEL